MTLRTVSPEYEAKNCCSLLRKNNNSFWHLRTFDSIRFSTHSKYNYQKPPLAPPKDNSTHIKADDCPGGQPSVNVIIFRGSKRLGMIGEVVTCSVLAAPNSRAAVSLS